MAQQRRVVNGGNSVGHDLPGGVDEPVTAWQHVIGAEPAHQLLVVIARVGEHAEPAVAWRSESHTRQAARRRP